jgi:hypothetical protein
MADVIGQLGAACRDMQMAATLSDERRLALERHAVRRFWNAIDGARTTDRLEPVRRLPGC